MADQTKWFCRGCWVRSAVIVPDEAGLYEGVTILRESHRRVSPECPRNEQRMVGDKASKGDIDDMRALPFVLDPAHPEAQP